MVYYSEPSSLTVSLILLSNSFTLRGLYPIDEKGISKHFLNYFHSLDTSLGAKALGPDQTISAKVSSTIQTATQHAKTVDEQKGYTKIAEDVFVLQHLSFICD